MADCQETLRELDAFLDDGISDDARAHIHEHLEHCVDCQGAFEFHVDLKIAIRRKCSNDEMPPALLSKIEQCFDQDFDGDGILGPE